MGWDANSAVTAFVGAITGKPSAAPRPERRAARAVGRFLAWDGATADGLRRTLSAWLSIGGTPPTLLDLVSETPNHGTYTRLLIAWAAEGSVNLHGRTKAYRDYEQGRAKRRLCDVVRRLYRAERSLWNVTYRIEHAPPDTPGIDALRVWHEAARYAYDHLLTAEPEAFEGARREFERRAPAAEVTDAMRTGACDRVSRWICNYAEPMAFRDRMNFLLNKPALVEVMNHLFPEGVDVFREGVRREMAHYENAGLFASGGKAPDLAVWGAADPISGRRGRQVVRFSRTLSEPERQVIVDMGLLPVTEDLIARIDFPR